MLEGCERMSALAQRVGRADFANSVERLAIERLLTIVGEAAKGVPREVQAQAPGVPWRALAGMRDRLSHAYADTDTDVVWTAAVDHAPRTAAALRVLLGGM
jgi:uncharacterized protein with HEPN domain